MDLGLTGRTALVCASTSGLGEAVARALDAEGARVVVSGRRAQRAREIAGELARAVGVGFDLGDPAGPAALVAAACEAFTDIDILVLNGGGPPVTAAADLGPAEVTAAMERLLLAHLRLVSEVLPAMRARGWGRILAVGASGMLAPMPGLVLSNTGRAALAGYLKTLAGEVAADGVTVNLLIPGRITTARVETLAAGLAARDGLTVDEVIARDAATIPAGRFGDPAEFAAVAAFLVSDAASYITGTATRCDGGQMPTL